MLQATANPAIVRQLETLDEQPAAAWKNRDSAGSSGAERTLLCLREHSEHLEVGELIVAELDRRLK